MTRWMLALLLGATCGAGLLRAAQDAKAPADELAPLKAELARLKGLAPDQAHAMADVGYHFGQLWFAGQAENWPLAQFYSDETRSHLRWAVRIIPVRKDAEGREIDLAGILAGLETSTLKELAEAIKAKDKGRFSTAYTAQIAACMACHKASNKPYLRLRIPEKPEGSLMEFRPE
jgi:hypothetical protein